MAGGILDDMQRIFNVVSAVVKHPAAYPLIKVASAPVSIYLTRVPAAAAAAPAAAAAAAAARLDSTRLDSISV